VLAASNLLLRFLLELCMLGAVAVWGFKTGDNAAMQALLGVGAPLLMAVVWGVFVSPKATVKLSPAAWIGLQAVLFGAAAVALTTFASPALAAGFLVVVALNGATAAQQP
jgi:hypothetical protein